MPAQFSCEILGRCTDTSCMNIMNLTLFKVTDLQLGYSPERQAWAKIK